MASVALTLGDTVRSFPILSENPSEAVQKAIRRILEKTTHEIIQKLKIPGRDYNDRTWTLRESWRRRRMRGYKYKVWSPTEYASFIENGTYKIKARKMLHREVANARSRLRRRLRVLAGKVSRGLI